MEKKFQQFLSYIQKIQSRAMDQVERNSNLKLQEFDYKDFPPQMIAIDGSNRWLWYNPDINTRIAVIRAANVLYEFKNSSKPPLKLIKQRCRDKAVLISPDNPDIHDYDQNEKKLHEGIKGVLAGKFGQPKPRNIIAILRSLEEFRLAEESAQTYSDSIIVLDGALSYVRIKEFEKIIFNLNKLCSKNNNILIGLSKRNTTRYFDSTLTDEAAFKEKARNVSSLCFMEGKNDKFQTDQKYPILGKTFFAKLHPEPVKTFRVDILAPNRDIVDVLSYLAYYSKVDSFLGYPFPLVEAHNIAALLRKVPDMYNQTLIDAGFNIGLNDEEIFNFLIDKEKMEVDPFHRYLDDLTR